MLARERLDALARSLEAFAKRGWLDLHRLGRFGCGQLEDFSEHVGKAVWPVEALEHSQRAADLDFLGEHRSFAVGGHLRRQAFRQILGEVREAQAETLDR